MLLTSTAVVGSSFVLVPDSRVLLTSAASFSFRLTPDSKMLLASAASFSFRLRLVPDSISDWSQIQFQISEVSNILESETESLTILNLALS